MVAYQAPGSRFETPAAPNLATLRQVFASVTADSCPQVYNFHMHTRHSDGQLQPEALIQQACEIGLRGLAITDHHQINGYFAAQRWLKLADRSVYPVLPHLWTGTEITSRLLDTEVHILGYDFDPQHPAIAPYLQGMAPRGTAAIASVVIAAIHAAGGLVVLAHPARYRRSYEDLIPAAVEAGVDGVETYYAYGNPKPWQPSPRETQSVRYLAEKYQLLSTCGTDSHGLSLLQRV